MTIHSSITRACAAVSYQTQRLITDCKLRIANGKLIRPMLCNLQSCNLLDGKFLGTVSVAVGVALAVCSVRPTSLQAQAQAQAPPKGDAPKGRSGDLAKSVPFDRITLVDNTVVEVEPVSPRPLPTPDLQKAGKSLLELEEMAKKAQARARNKRSGRPDDDEDMVVIHILEGEPRDFKVKRASIKAIEYFEDLLLNDADRLIALGDFTRAFERQLLVKTRNPDWRGLDDAVNRLLFAEGSATLLEDDGRGLRLLNDLLARKPNYPGLVDRLATAFARKIDRSLAAGDFFGGRELLRGLTKIAATHGETGAARAKFVARARALTDAAAKANPSDRVDRLAEAARVWPELEGLDRAHAEAFRSEPTIRVAVVDLADPVGPFPESGAAERAARLIYLPVLANDDEASLRGESSGQLLASWSVLELGSTWRIGLKPDFRWSDGSRPASAIDVARSLADRASGASPGYNARWADLLDRITVLDENRLEVKLTRSTAKPETWLLDPVGPAHASSDGWVSSVAGGRLPVGDGPFRWKSADAAGTTFEASRSTPADATPRIKRIIEVPAASTLTLAERIGRGEVDLIDHVPPGELAEMAKLPEVKVGAYQSPSVHRLAVDGRTPALANRKLRRGLSMAIDRVTLLQDQILGHPPTGPNKVADAPFVRGSFVADPNVNPLEYNPVLAKGLIAAAIKELGGNPIKLTLEYPSIAEARATVPKIASAIRALGVEVEAIERPESSLEAGLRSGRRFDLAYRASRPTDPLRDAGPLLIPAYDAPPSSGGFASAASPRILQLLIELDRAPEPQSARRLAVQVDHESRDELPVIPLWQVEDHYAWRSNVRGPAGSTDQFYRGAVTWEAEPWLAKDP